MPTYLNARKMLPQSTNIYTPLTEVSYPDARNAYVVARICFFLLLAKNDTSIHELNTSMHGCATSRHEMQRCSVIRLFSDDTFRISGKYGRTISIRATK